MTIATGASLSDSAPLQIRYLHAQRLVWLQSLISQHSQVTRHEKDSHIIKSGRACRYMYGTYYDLLSVHL